MSCVTTRNLQRQQSAILRRSAAPSVFTMAVAQNVGAGNFGLTAASGQTLVVDWGDGSTSNVSGSGMQYPTHTYASPSTPHTVTVSDRSYIVGLKIYDAAYTVRAGELGALTSLTYLQVEYATSVHIGSGEIAALTGLTYLRVFVAEDISFAAGELSALTALATLYLRQINRYAGEYGIASDETIRGLSITIRGETAYQQLSATQVGYAVQAVDRAGASGGTLLLEKHGVAEGDLDATSTTALAAIRARGWTVTIS